MELLKKYLYLLYDNLNKLFYDGTLPPVCINFSYSEKQRTFRITRMKNDQFIITINWTYLHSTEEDLYINMLHQMAHIYNATRGIKDTSRATRYHNKKWSDEVNRMGVITELNGDKTKENIGWMAVDIEVETVEKIRTFFDYEKFYEIVLDRTKPELASQLVVYQCPYCRRTVYANPKSDNMVLCGYDFNKYIRLD